MTVRELVALYLEHARSRYASSRHAKNLELGLRPLADRDWPAASFGAVHLRGYRESLLERGICRRTINQWVGWVRAMYRWAVSRGYPLAEAWRVLCAVEPLRRNEAGAVDRPRRPLVTLEDVAVISDALPDMVRRMVCVQWLCAMRPGEVIGMRWWEFTRGERFWLYTPDAHKTASMNLFRSIVVVPEAVRALGVPREADYVFVTPSGGPYSYDSYAQCVRRACRRKGVPEWAPGQLRHSAATYAQRLAGIEVAQRLLGHTTSRTTERYLRLGDADMIAVGDRLVREGFTFAGVC